jgi:hypothetical protein
MKGTCVKIVLTLALLVGFTCGTVYAQDFSIWDGSLWKIKFTAKGVVFSNLDNIPSGKARGTEQSWAIMSSNAAGDVMSLSIYGKDPDTGECELPQEIPLTLQFGGPLGFVATIESDSPEPNFESIRGLVYFTGKLKNAELNTGKITTLGGYNLQQDWDDPTDRAAFGFTLSGSLLKEPKGCLLP